MVVVSPTNFTHDQFGCMLPSKIKVWSEWGQENEHESKSSLLKTIIQCCIHPPVLKT